LTTLALWLVSFGGRSTVLALTTLNIVVLARALGPLGSGKYFLFVSLVLVLTAIADLGISQSAVVFAGKPGLSLSQLRQAVLVLSLGVSSVVAIVASVALVSLPPIGAGLLAGIPAEWPLVALALLPFSVYARFWSGLMIGTRRVVEVNAVQMLMSALTLAANIVFVATTGDLTAAVAIYAVVFVAQAASMFVLAKRLEAGRSKPAEVRSLAREMVIFGIRGYPGSVSTMLWTRAAVFVLNAFHGPTAVGVYSVAQQLAEKTLVPILAIQDVLYARMSRLSRPEATAALNRALRVTVAAILPTIAVVLVVSPALVTAVFSGSFDAASAPLRPLLIGSAIQSIPVILATYFLAQLRRPGLLSLLTWLNAALNLALLLALVPSSAEMGAALAMLASQAAGTIVVLWLYLRIAKTDAVSALILHPSDVVLVKGQAAGLIRR
jgi:O-antigen/teichoic acid export membrane protein